MSRIFNRFRKIECHYNGSEYSVKYYWDFLNTYYNINSISLIVDDTMKSWKLKLVYTYFDYTEKNLSLYSNKENLIVEYNEIADKYDYLEAKDELFKFGKMLSMYLNLKFIIFDLSSMSEFIDQRFGCEECGETITSKIFTEEIIDKYKIDRERFKVRKEKYPFLKSNQMGQINRSITLRIKNYENTVIEGFYCESCMNSLKSGCFNWITNFTNGELIRYYQKNSL